MEEERDRVGRWLRALPDGATPIERARAGPSDELEDADAGASRRPASRTAAVSPRKSIAEGCRRLEVGAELGLGVALVERRRARAERDHRKEREDRRGAVLERERDGVARPHAGSGELTREAVDHLVELGERHGVAARRDERRMLVRAWQRPQKGRRRLWFPLH